MSHPPFCWRWLPVTIATVQGMHEAHELLEYAFMQQPRQQTLQQSWACGRDQDATTRSTHEGFWRHIFLFQNTWHSHEQNPQGAISQLTASQLKMQFVCFFLFPDQNCLELQGYVNIMMIVCVRHAGLRKLIDDYKNFSRNPKGGSVTREAFKRMDTI